MADDIENQPAPTAPMGQAIPPPLLIAPIDPPAQPSTEILHNSSAMVVDTTTNTHSTTAVHSTTVHSTLTENHSVDSSLIPENSVVGERIVEQQVQHASVGNNHNAATAAAVAANAGASAAAVEPVADLDGDGDIDMMSDHDGQEYEESESEYEPEPDSPPPSKQKHPKTSPSGAANKPPRTPVQGSRPPKTPTSRVRSGRVEKSSSPASQGNLRCPVKGCGQTFTGRNPRQSLWHHLKYYATRGLPDRQDFEKLHGEAHSEMKREAGK